MLSTPLVLIDSVNWLPAADCAWTVKVESPESKVESKVAKRTKKATRATLDLWHSATLVFSFCLNFCIFILDKGYP